ncbi:TetR/AcrR family transcriptional regulator [Actinoplanes sp. URMC 104]|uniref:TetR/AcrR family transcriptional regulator n=1 Tax=Actinoplanes sp. URMC 104 TaxID=3423409 RepID=UPI003F19F285
MPPPKVHNEALRSALLTRAAELVSTQGPDALSLRRLAKDVGTSTTAVYSLFGSKAALLDELYREAVHRFAAALATVEPTADPLADVIRMGVVYREYALSDPHLYEIMFNRSWSDPSTAGEELLQTFRPLLDAVQRGLESGLLRPAPAESIALSCWATVHGLVTLELNGIVPPGAAVGDHHLAILTAPLDGWRAHPPQPPPPRP